jgi:secretion/DNA translocation related CpaE-like protein
VAPISSGSVRSAVLVAASDPALLESVHRLAAAAGTGVRRADDITALRRHWNGAVLVLLDAAAVRRCAEAGLPRRDHVVVVTGGEPAPELWRLAVAVGAERVVPLPAGESWLVSRFTEALEGARRGGAVLGVVGGRGGAGASALAAAVAVASARGGEQTLLVDCDPLGGGLDLAVGAEDTDGLRWPDIDVGGGRIPATALHAALPALSIGRGGAVLGLLSCDRSPVGPTPAAVTAVVDAGRRAGETVVCDLPRHPTDAALAVLSAADLTVLLVPADVRSCAAATRVAALVTEHCATVRLLVRGPAPGGVAPDDVAAALYLSLLAAMPVDPGLARALERGTLPSRRRGPLAAAARMVLDELRAVTAAAPAGRP